MKTATYYEFFGECEEAMSFYRDVFGGKLDMVRFGDAYKYYPKAQANWSSKIRHCDLKDNAGTTIISGWDKPDRSGEPRAVSISQEYEHDEFEKGKNAFEKLIESGRVVSKFEKTEWSNDFFGECVDKNKLTWKITCKVPTN